MAPIRSSQRTSLSQARMRYTAGRPRPVLIQPDAGSESTGNDIPPPRIPQFNLEKTFTAISTPYTLLLEVRESRDFDALRALGPVFCHCIDAILHSLANLPEHVSTSAQYHVALSEVTFSKDMLLAHVTRLTHHDRSSSRPESIRVAIELLEFAMSRLKHFLKVAALEAAQSKSLPHMPDADAVPAQVTDGSEAAPSEPSSPVCPQLRSSPVALTSGSTETLDQSLKSKVSAFFKPFRERISGKASRPDLSNSDSSSSATPVSSDHSALCSGYVHISVNIRSSLAQFPVVINPTVGKVPHPEDDVELWKDSYGLAQLASLKSLVRHITSPDVDNDPEIVEVFFLCFRLFSNSQEILDALITRYDEDVFCESSSATQAHSMQVKIRIARLLYLWVDLHWRPEDIAILNGLTQFTFSRLARDMPQEASSTLVTSLLQRAHAGDKSKGLRKEKTVARAEARYRQDPLSCNFDPPEKKAMAKGDFSSARLEHFNSPGGHTMVALQLTLLLWEKYRAFEPEEAVRYLMTRDGDSSSPISEVALKVETFMAYEKAVHRFVMDSIGTAESVQMRTTMTEFFLEVAQKCHELRNYSASCLIVLACDRPTVLPFITKLKLSPTHERMKDTLKNFYTKENHHMASYKQALQSCSCPALPGMMLFIREVSRGCGSGAYDQHPSVPGSRLINLKRYRPITWAVRAMERCHAPFKIQRVDYMCAWLEHVLSPYLVGSETEWEKRIYENCRRQ